MLGTLGREGPLPDIELHASTRSLTGYTKAVARSDRFAHYSPATFRLMPPSAPSFSAPALN